MNLFRMTMKHTGILHEYQISWGDLPNDFRLQRKCIRSIKENLKNIYGFNSVWGNYLYSTQDLDEDQDIPVTIGSNSATLSFKKVHKIDLNQLNPKTDYA